MFAYTQKRRGYIAQGDFEIRRFEFAYTQKCRGSIARALCIRKCRGYIAQELTTITTIGEKT